MAQILPSTLLNEINQVNMKKIITSITFLFFLLCGVQAQKYALIDMQYILKNVPSYETANEQLNIVSKKWQKEIETQRQEVEKLYKNYQTELVFLSDEMKKQREEEIIAKEKELNELKRKYFGQDGELYKKRESLLKPIQDEIYTAVQEVAQQKGYDMIIDRSSDMSLIYSASKLDVSDQVLEKLGYSK